MSPEKKPTKRSDGKVEIFCRYIVKKGKRIYPKNGQCFHFFVTPKKP